MKIPLIALLLVGLAAPGCSNLMRREGIEATNLSAVKVGATRAEVEGVLGEPVKRETAGAGMIDTYEFDAGIVGENVDPLFGRPSEGTRSAGEVCDEGCVYVMMAVLAIRIAAEPFLFVSEMARRGEQVAKLVITYGPADRVVRMVTEDPASAEAKARIGDAAATDEDVAPDDMGATPFCDAVGGYEAYMKKTGKVCLLD